MHVENLGVSTHHTQVSRHVGSMTRMTTEYEYLRSEGSLGSTLRYEYFTRTLRYF